MTLPWLEADTPFPPVERAWAAGSDAPGLLAAGASLDVERLKSAYSQGIFPWFSEGQPILWWSTDPRMVLETAHFRIRRSFKKVLRRFRLSSQCEIRIDYDFAGVIQRCASATRKGQRGTWIVPEMQRAYVDLHRRGFAHSVETWIDGQIAGGLYCVVIGKAVFGESMFSLQPEASKIALAALVAVCRSHGVAWIDCQQQTEHLQSMGANPIARADFCARLPFACGQPSVGWSWETLYWDSLDLGC